MLLATFDSSPGLEPMEPAIAERRPLRPRFEPFAKVFLACIWIEALPGSEAFFPEAAMNFHGGMSANHLVIARLYVNFNSGDVVISL
jgi:hypothetical protein